jgi:hypothetical protein
MTRFSKLAVGFLPALILVACYNTSSVENGGLVCGAGDACPDGFYCAKGACWKNGIGPGDACEAPFGPFVTCSAGQDPAGSTCDPVCQSECACGRRCVLNSTATSFLCEAAGYSQSFAEPGQTCEDPDSCAPGSVCLGDLVCPNLCYRTCRADQDCPVGTYCTKVAIENEAHSAIGGVYLCSPPAEACDPTGPATCLAGRAGFACVFLAGLTGVAISDATVCDCASFHSEKVGAVCTSKPDNCQPGAVCADGRCRTICSKSAGASACPSGTSCAAMYNSSQYGYCR